MSRAAPLKLPFLFPYLLVHDFLCCVCSGLQRTSRALCPRALLLGTALSSLFGEVLLNFCIVLRVLCCVFSLHFPVLEILLASAASPVGLRCGCSETNVAAEAPKHFCSIPYNMTDCPSAHQVCFVLTKSCLNPTPAAGCRGWLCPIAW